VALKYISHKLDPWFWSDCCWHRPLRRTRLDFVVIWFSDWRDSVNISLGPAVNTPSDA
jgi:hypothetical protein